MLLCNGVDTSSNFAWRESELTSDRSFFAREIGESFS
jgi:hypothetical protein